MLESGLDPAVFLKALDRDGELVETAVRYARMHPDEAGRVLHTALASYLAEVAELTDADAIVEMTPPGGWLWPLLLGELGYEPAHETLLELVKQSDLVLEVFLGDMLPECMESVLWRTSGGRADGLVALLEDVTVNTMSRAGAVAGALVLGVADGTLDHDEVLDRLAATLVLADDPRLADWPDGMPGIDSPGAFNDMMTGSMYDLWPERVMPRLERLFTEGPLETYGPPMVGLDGFHKVLRRGRAAQRRQLQAAAADSHNRRTRWIESSYQKDDGRDHFRPIQTLTLARRNSERGRKKHKKKRGKQKKK